KRKTALSESRSRLAALCYGHHRESAGALQPIRVFGSPVELKKCIPVAARAVTEVGSFDERPGAPGEFAALNKQGFELGGANRRAGKSRHHSRCPVTGLA